MLAQPAVRQATSCHKWRFVGTTIRDRALTRSRLPGTGLRPRPALDRLHSNPVAPIRFGFKQASFRQPHQCWFSFTALGPVGHKTNANSHDPSGRVRVWDPKFAHCFDQAVTHKSRLVMGDVTHDQGKLPILMASGQIARALGIKTDRVSNNPETFVTVGHAKRLVETAKIVDINDCERYGQPVTGTPAPFVIEECFEAAAVCQAREFINQGKLIYRLLRKPDVGDVLVGDHKIGLGQPFARRHPHSVPALFLNAVIVIFLRIFCQAAVNHRPHTAGSSAAVSVTCGGGLVTDIQVIDPLPIDHAVRVEVAGLIPRLVGITNVTKSVDDGYTFAKSVKGRPEENPAESRIVSQESAGQQCGVGVGCWLVFDGPVLGSYARLSIAAGRARAARKAGCPSGQQPRSAAGATRPTALFSHTAFGPGTPFQR